MNKYIGLKTIFFFFFIGITLFIYNPFALYFLNDDMIHLPLSSKGVLFQHNSFRPIHDLLLITEYKLWGLNALAYHLVEWGIHVVCSVLVYLFSYRVLKTYGKYEEKSLVIIALFTASLFSVYAFHSESVLWILGSGASLATIFFLLSVIVYIKRKDGIIHFIASLLFFQIGLFTYEAIWVAPVFILLLSYESIRIGTTQWKKERLYISLYWLSFLGNLLLRKIFIGELAGTYGSERVFDFNLKHLLYNGVCFFTRSFVPPSQSTSVFAGSMVALVILLFIVFRKVFVSKKLDSFLLILIISFLCSLLPVVNLGISTHSRESERFLYLPSVFLCLLIILVLTRILSYSKMLLCFGGLVLYNTYFTYINARDYGVASSISKAFYNHFERDQGNDTIILKGFPRQFNGLPLFRSGFKEGLSSFYNIDTCRILVADEEEMKTTSIYNKELTKRNFEFYFKENKVGLKKELKLVYNSTYFSMVEFNN